MYKAKKSNIKKKVGKNVAETFGKTILFNNIGKFFKRIFRKRR